MGSRVDLQSVLENTGVAKVYFQPPESVRLCYPCIIYHLSSIDKRYADDITYNYFRRYSAVLIDTNPDSKFIEKILLLPYCRFDRFYTSDNLNHWTFEIYY